MGLESSEGRPSRWEHLALRISKMIPNDLTNHRVTKILEHIHLEFRHSVALRIEGRSKKRTAKGFTWFLCFVSNYCED